MQALAAFEQGDHEEAAARCLESRDAAAANEGRRHVQRAGPQFILANIAVSSGDNDRAQALYDEAIGSLGVPEKRGAWASSFR